MSKNRDSEEAPVEEAAPHEGERLEQAQEAAEDSVEARLAKAEARLAEEHDRALRLAAEIENMRRRSARDLENAHRYGHERFAAELLPVADSLDLALSSAGDAPEGVREGLEMTLKLLHDIFASHHIEVIDPAGEPFDPEFHEAMATQPGGEVAPDHVLEVVQKGYRLHDRLLRPARVIVARTPE
ncbi:MAG: nucleotide exchange factor GrpE [Gammaproteobacteria bacterium]|nr:nucleotide exchange factor GrpE [Gammaproteobacteria bacterium]